MDPVSNVKEQLQLAVQLAEPVDVDELKADCEYDENAENGTVDQLIDYKNALEDRLRSLAIDAARLAELVAALDGWRLGGGFDPYGPAAGVDVDLPSTAQMAALGRLLRQNGADGATIGLGMMALPADYLGVTLRYGRGQAPRITAAGIDLEGRVST